MSKRAYNFNAGPAALPLEVLEQAQRDLVDFQGIGMSVMEISHRSKEYETLNEHTQQLIKELLHIPAGYKVLFLQGGASTQFAMIPMNLLGENEVAYYAVSGSWAKKSIKEAQKIGQAQIAAQEPTFDRVPDLSSWSPDDGRPAYLHITSNETIEGIQYQTFPETENIPLIVDMSSDILSRPIDVSRFDLIYAGAQKNLGPSGVTVVIIREELLDKAPRQLPAMMQYGTHAKANSLYNTPPVYSVYVMNMVLQWIQRQGGLAAIAERNKTKADLLYRTIDESDGFYQGTVEVNSRSAMNVPFRLENEQLDKAFLEASIQEGFVGLKGHRSVGGLRASIYNAVPQEHCEALADFMKTFQSEHRA